MRRVMDGLTAPERPRERDAARLSEALALTTPPVALAFVEGPPAGMPQREETALAACEIWRLAETATFYVPAASHLGCAIGARTLGFAGAEAQPSLAETIGAMNAAGYLDPAEVARLPMMSRPASGVLYGPLAAFPADPDLALMWVTARGAMLIAEATEAARWDGTAGISMTGRPGCAALPVADAARGPVLSLGCTGMRMRTGVGDALMLAGLSGAALAPFLAALEATARANRVMDDYYLAKR